MRRIDLACRGRERQRGAAPRLGVALRELDCPRGAAGALKMSAHRAGRRLARGVWHRKLGRPVDALDEKLPRLSSGIAPTLIVKDVRRFNISGPPSAPMPQ